MGIAEIKANLINHIGKIDLDRLTIAELRDYCGLVKDADGLTRNEADMVTRIMNNLSAGGFGFGYNRPAPTKGG